MEKDVFDQINKALKDRGTWETRQDTWYKMRHTGIRRPVKPYPNAPDQHYPLVDTVIEKLKPFYAQQIYANERMATFTSQKGAAREITTMAEQDFDYNIKNRSNFENALLIATDTHLQNGFCPIKIYWDEEKNQLAFDPIDPLYVIVPQWTEELQSADWLVHVITLSRSQYEANTKYRQGDTFVTSICGRGADSYAISSVKDQDKASREGLTYAADDEQIILWECYTEQDGKWMIETISPIIGWDDPVRDPFGLPYKHGMLPFVQLRAEIKEKGYYSSRGISEIIFKHELDLCKTWNAKLQYLDFFGQPNFKNNSLSPLNAANFQNQPGKILPPGIEKEAPMDAPLDFEKEMQFVRALAEDRIRIPDLGASQSLTGDASKRKGGDTATAVNAIIGLTSQSNDLRARIFRLQLAEIYQQAWQLRVQFASDQLQYIYDNTANDLPVEALTDSYTITPSGSADSWNVAARAQKALGMYQLLFGKPNVNQDELLKYALENGDDPLLVKRLFQDTGQQQAEQGEKQASEINNMLIGYPVQVKPDDQDQVHLQTQVQFLQKRMQSGEPLTPEFMQLTFQHMGLHVQALANKKDKSANQWKQQLKQLVQMYQQAQSQQPPAPQPTSPQVMQAAQQQVGAQPPQQPQLPPTAPNVPVS